MSEVGRDGEGSGEGGDTYEVSLTLELLSLDTHRRDVTGAYGALSTDVRRKTQVNCAQKSEDM